jgi:hypothetical protein
MDTEGNKIIYKQKMKVWLDLIMKDEKDIDKLAQNMKLAKAMREELGDLFFDPAMPSICDLINQKEI